MSEEFTSPAIMASPPEKSDSSRTEGMHQASYTVHHNYVAISYGIYIKTLQCRDYFNTEYCSQKHSIYEKSPSIMLLLFFFVSFTMAALFSVAFPNFIVQCLLQTLSHTIYSLYKTRVINSSCTPHVLVLYALCYIIKWVG